MNEGLKDWCAWLALREMDMFGVDEWWVGGEMVTRFECERLLGDNDDE